MLSTGTKLFVVVDNTLRFSCYPPLTVKTPRDYAKPMKTRENSAFVHHHSRQLFHNFSDSFHQKMDESSDSDDDRFAHYEDEEVDDIRDQQKKKNTKKSDKKTKKLFIEYLQASWCTKVPHYEYWKFEFPLLDKILTKFWFEARRKNKDRYTVNSLKHVRYGLNRNLKNRGIEVDLLKSECFTNSQNAFQDACSQLKSLGYGYVKHYDEIKPSGK